ncbi:uncharacterized protein B0J16DRAFT_369082 [Fusarium flagelliforme]|uniref:uncharacterized protein n=1 Tax=Fusarium flagelliforme TaxID=2675880 RepID=UPI001E8CF0BC|nr:uncharacterized protein B0J16DRAFT_369082 [Fusarium flagelliforme]KAH7192911.1 hypothetical protein B0J16DRAFT_369082 [Fusarium flagelliforme]
MHDTFAGDPIDRGQPSSSASLNHQALHPPETFAPPSTIISAAKEEDSETELNVNDRAPRSTALSRERLFASLEVGDYFLRPPRPIASANDLDGLELKRCFEILHACHIATETDATLVSTGRTMEDFLEAVFETDGLEKPKFQFTVREFLQVGNVCGEPSHHQTISACEDSLACQMPVYGIATYRSYPAQLSISFSTHGPPRRSSEPLQGLFCPMERTDVRFQDEQHWMVELRQNMKRACLKKVHMHNKRLAVWYVRILARGWAKGSIWMGKDVKVLSFVSRGAVDASFAMMGDFNGHE